jgi:AraC-like DNA-binding protein
MSQTQDFAPVRFSTDLISQRERVPFWREAFGRHVVGIDVEPLSDAFEAEAIVRKLPDLRTISFSSAPAHNERSGSLVANGDDGVALLVNMGGPMTITHRGREMSLDSGDATLLLHAEPSRVVHSQINYQGLIVARSALASLVTNVEDVASRRIRNANPALRLLVKYLEIVRADAAMGGPELHHLIATHVHDLLATIVGPHRDGAAIAARGVRAARLAVIKSDIRAHLGGRSLGVSTIAARHKLSRRSVQVLLETAGITFSQFVLEQRLARARRMFVDPRHADATISAIALAVGFGEISYFNRNFRRRYGVTPSELRNAPRS